MRSCVPLTDERRRQQQPQRSLASFAHHLTDASRPDHDQPYVQEWLAEYGERKVEANALVTNPEAGRQLFRETLAKYLSEQPRAKQEERRGELEKEIKTQLTEIGLDTRTLHEALERLGRTA